MKNKTDHDLFFTCSLIEQIGRDCLRKRSDVVSALGIARIKRIYDYADVLHSEPIQKVADDLITEHGLQKGTFDNVKNCRYAVPDVWTIGKVYARLIEDVTGAEDLIDTLLNVYSAWIDAAISNYNTDFFYQQREYVAESYREGQPIDL